jgi:hypothetical protein
MKRPDSFLTNTTAPAGRALGQAINDPGGSTGSGVDQEIYNDPAYAIIATAESWKEGGIGDANETTTASDMRDAVEEMVSKKVSGVSDYNPATNYAAPGTATDLVMHKGFQFINISNVGNLGNDPLLNPDLWFKIPKVDTLMDQYYSGDSISGGLSPVADRAGAKYLQNMLFGNYRLGGNGDDFYDFFRVALDGSVVTGDATLEAIFGIGGTEYFNIDIIAPDVVGTRTLLDMGEYIATPQSVSGENDAMGVLLDDRGQGHWHEYYVSRTLSSGAGTALDQLTSTGAVLNPNQDRIQNLITDGVNGTPRTGLTTRPKELTVGASYIIVMVAA